MKNIVVVHGIGGIEREPYFPHLKQTCQDLGLEVFMPSLGSYKDQVTYEIWKDYFDKNILPYIDKNTIFVAQSLGTQFAIKYIVEKNNMTNKVTIDSTKFASPDALRLAIIAGEVDYAILPEPMVTIATNANKNLKVTLDLTDEWNKVSGGKQLVQGCVVVRKEFANQYPGSVKAFLKEYKSSIEALNSDPATAAISIKEFGIFANDKVATKAIPNCNIEYLDGNEMETAMSNFLDAMYTVAPASIGNAVPNKDFYYGA